MKRYIKTSLLFIVFFLNISCNKSHVQQTNRINFVTIEEELLLGEEIKAASIRHLNLVRHREIDRYFDKLANKIGKVSHWQALTYDVFIVNEQDINHFSLPGGNIYLYRGLIQMASTEDQIASMIAHEVAHAARRDAVERLAEKYSYAFAAQKVFGENPEIANHILTSLYTSGTILDYPKEAEQIADRYAIKYCQVAGFNPHGLPELLNKIRACENKNLIRRLLLTHSTVESRLVMVTKALKGIPSSKQSNSSEFQKIKNILQRIPVQ